jgi:hypothetical protein
MATKVPLRLMSLVWVMPVGQMIVNGAFEPLTPLMACVVRRDAAGVGLEWCEYAGVARNAMASLAGLHRDWTTADESPMNAVGRAPASPMKRRMADVGCRQYRYRLEFRD